MIKMIEEKIDKKIINSIDIFIIKKRISTIKTFDGHYNGTNIKAMFANNKNFIKYWEDNKWYLIATPNHDTSQININEVYWYLYTLTNNGRTDIFDGSIKVNENANIFIDNLEDWMFWLSFKELNNKYRKAIVKLSWKYRPIVIIEYNEFNNKEVNITIIHPNENWDIIKTEDTITLSEINSFITNKVKKWINNNWKIVKINNEITWLFHKTDNVKIKTCYNPITEQAPFCIDHYNNKLLME